MAKPVAHYGKFRIRWIEIDGTRKSATYATEDEAEVQLRRHELRVLEARRGGAPMDPSAHTFRDLADHWLATRAKTKKFDAEDRSMIKVHLGPAFDPMTLAQISTAKIAAWAATDARSPKSRHNTLTLLGTMLNHAVELGWLPVDVKPRIRRPKLHQAEDYAWISTDREVSRFLTAALDEGRKVQALYATGIYTGMRLGELCGLQWSAVDFGRRLITVRRSFASTTKAGYIRHVPLFDALLPVLKDWHDRDDNDRARIVGGDDLVFPNLAGRMFGHNAPIFRSTYHRVLQAAELESPGGDFDEHGRHRLRFHSLRHSFASRWVATGGDIYKLRKIGGWRSMDLVMRYAHLAPDIYKDDLGRFGSGVSPGKRKVVAMRGT